MRTAVCPGSFDPVTNGHLDVFTRAAALFEHVTVAVLVNPSKTSMFSVDERLDLLREVTSDYENVTVDFFDGLIVDFCKAHDVKTIVKGIRAVSDFDYELQMAQMNNRLAEVETVFIPTDPAYGYLSSSLVKEVAKHGGDVSGLVPDLVLRRMAERFAESRTAEK